MVWDSLLWKERALRGGALSYSVSEDVGDCSFVDLGRRLSQKKTLPTKEEPEGI